MVTKANTPNGPVAVLNPQAKEFHANISDQQDFPKVEYPWVHAPRAANAPQEPIDWTYDEFEEDWVCDDGNHTIWWSEVQHEIQQNVVQNAVDLINTIVVPEQTGSDAQQSPTTPQTPEESDETTELAPRSRQ